MPSFSRKSRENLNTCDERLQRLFNEIIKHWDCTILEGHRGKEEQQAAYEDGKSQIQWPNGKHNKYPSRAVDVAPYPIDWQNTRRFDAFSGYVLGVARMMGIPIRWGGDWDGDRDLDDQSFNDLVHFEIDE